MTGVAIVGKFYRSPSAMSSLKKPSASGKKKRKFANISTDTVESDSSSSSSSLVSSSASSVSDSDSDSGSETEGPLVREAEAVTDEPDDPVLSHAEKRRQKKRKLNSGDVVSADVSESPTKATSTLSKSKKGRGKKGEGPGEIPEGDDALPKRQNSVWVGNLAYKTTTVTLKAFFEGLDITRIHMPMKAPQSGTGPKVNSG